MTDLGRLTLTQLLAGLNAGHFSSGEVLDDCLDTLLAREGALGAFAHPVDPDEIRARWSVADHAAPLRGLPIAVKDTFDVADMPAERGSPIYQGRIAGQDAAPVSALTALGAFVLGKTVTTEFAYFSPGRTVNPHDPRRTPGGSSSGSAAAVAAHIAPLALGSQTAASVIRPAAYCGTAAWVASRGMFALRGVLPLAQSFDSAGYFARAAGDLLLLHDLLTKTADQTRPQRPARLYYHDGGIFGPVDAAMQAEFSRLVAALTGLGIAMVPFPTERAAHWVERHKLLMAREAAQNFQTEARHHAALLSPQFRALLADGEALRGADWQRLMADQTADAAWLGQALAGFDGILAPAAPGAAPLGLDATGQPHMSRPWQLFGLPQVTFPFACDPGRLPLGVQLIGPRWGDGKTLAMAAWLQSDSGCVDTGRVGAIAR